MVRVHPPQLEKACALQGFEILGSPDRRLQEKEQTLSLVDRGALLHEILDYRVVPGAPSGTKRGLTAKVGLVNVDTHLHRRLHGLEHQVGWSTPVALPADDRGLRKDLGGEIV